VIKALVALAGSVCMCLGAPTFFTSLIIGVLGFPMKKYASLGASLILLGFTLILAATEL
jgi:hypothetical protein